MPPSKPTSKPLEAFEGAAIQYSQAEGDFIDEFGASTPDGIPKALREDWAAIDRKFARVRLKTHEEITKLRHLPGWLECIGPLHRELNRQTAIFNQRVEPLRLANEAACDASAECAIALAATKPTSIEGAAALLSYFAELAELGEQSPLPDLDDPIPAQIARNVAAALREKMAA